MNNLASPDAIVNALRAEGCTVVEIAGWRNRNRNHVKAPGPWIGLLNHHTGAETSDPAAYAAGWLSNGSNALPGPLCNDSIGRDGIVYMVGYGRANHAGNCARNTYDLLLNDAMPLDHDHIPDGDAIDFNSLTWGTEIQGDTTCTPFGAAQYDAVVKHDAAMLRLFGWTAGSIAAHREATRRKPSDPTTNMAELRRNVNAKLSNNNNPKIEEVMDMAKPRIITLIGSNPQGQNGQALVTVEGKIIPLSGARISEEVAWTDSDAAQRYISLINNPDDNKVMDVQARDIARLLDR